MILTNAMWNTLTMAEIGPVSANRADRIGLSTSNTWHSIRSGQFGLLDFWADQIEGPELHTLRPSWINSSKTPQRAGLNPGTDLLDSNTGSNFKASDCVKQLRDIKFYSRH